jgi:hypothetical protein
MDKHYLNGINNEYLFNFIVITNYYFILFDLNHQFHEFIYLIHYPFQFNFLNSDSNTWNQPIEKQECELLKIYKYKIQVL